MYVPISGSQTGILAATAFAFLLAFMADAYTTMVGLEHGSVETNPVSRWFFSKIGQTGTVFVQAVAILIGGAAMSNWGFAPPEVFWGSLAVSETFFAVRNYLKLKAAKISLK
jgi:hypothetical protein